MTKKKLLVDLSILKNTHCGLGQVALNYGKYLSLVYLENCLIYVYIIFFPKERQLNRDKKIENTFE